MKDAEWHFSYAVSELSDRQLDRAMDQLIHARWRGDPKPMMYVQRVIHAEQWRRKHSI